MDRKQSLKQQPLNGVTFGGYDRKSQWPQRFGRHEGGCACIPSKCGLLSAIFPPLGLPQRLASAVTTSNHFLQCFFQSSLKPADLIWFLTSFCQLCLASP